MIDHSRTVEHVEVKRIPSYVTQVDQTVRVFRISPERIQLQLRCPKGYATATLTAADARVLTAFLDAGLRDLAGLKEIV